MGNVEYWPIGHLVLRVEDGVDHAQSILDIEFEDHAVGKSTFRRGRMDNPLATLTSEARRAIDKVLELRRRTWVRSEWNIHSMQLIYRGPRQLSEATEPLRNALHAELSRCQKLLLTKEDAIRQLEETVAMPGRASTIPFEGIRLPE